MDSVFQTPVPVRQAKFASVATSVLVHLLVVSAALVLTGPVWRTMPRPARTVTPLVMPVPAVPLKVVRAAVITPRPVSSDLPALPLAAPPPRPTAAPAATTRRTVRIEAPPEPMPATTTLMPAATMPSLAVKPLVQLGLLDPASTSVAAPKARTAEAGFDGMGAAAASRGGRGLAQAGFGEPAMSDARPPKRQATTGGFDQREATVVPAARAKVVTTPFEGIEILEKPRPVYTEEAKRLRIEGTVQLRVVFGAAGQIKVVSVIKGLGHGLDEAAVQAAEAIRYRPAKRDGRPVDAPAVIQIQFQLA